jgi:branched-subunit amino acid aminotransferase/4-amino-4-deoxychorismate lyase
MFEQGHFTSFRARYVDGKFKIVSLDLHLERIIRASNNLKFKEINKNLVIKDLKESLVAFNTKYPSTDARVKIIVRDNEFQILISEAQNLELSSTISLYPFYQIRSNPKIKSCNTSLSVAGNTFAKNCGADECLFIENNLVRETGWGNLIWFDNYGNIVLTTINVLPGITQNVVSKLATKYIGLDLIDHNFTLIDILEYSRAVIVTNSYRGIVAITKIGDYIINNDIDFINNLNHLYWNSTSEFFY